MSFMTLFPLGWCWDLVADAGLFQVCIRLSHASLITVLTALFSVTFLIIAGLGFAFFTAAQHCIDTLSELSNTNPFPLDYLTSSVYM